MSTRSRSRASRGSVAARRGSPQGPRRGRPVRRRAVVLWIVGLLAVAGIVAAALASVRPSEQVGGAGGGEVAPAFTLPDSEGGTVSLASYAGRPVVLYFNEGAGCQACIVQMRQIEQDPDFARRHIAVLPIVMNTAEQINADRSQVGVRTPFLLDDGRVSRAYGMYGTGMHADLPGHGFVLVDPNGRIRWSQTYPSMWLDPADLLRQVQGHL